MSDSFIKRMFQPRGRGKAWWVFVFIMIIGIGAALLDFGNYYNKLAPIIGLPIVKEVPFRLGLDLLGGSQLTYEADVSGFASGDRTSAVEGARDVIERRVNFFGVSEPLVQINSTANGNYRILVELAGIKDINEAIKKIGETPLLEFKEQNTEPPRTLTAEEKQQMEEDNKKVQALAPEIIKKLQAGEDFTLLTRQYSDDSLTKEQGGYLGWISKETNPDIFFLTEKLVEAQGLNKPSTKPDQTTDGIEIILPKDIRATYDSNSQVQKEIQASHLLICFQGASGCENNLTKEQALEKIKGLKAQANKDNFSQLVKDNSTEPGANVKAGDLGWFGRGAMVKPFEDAIFTLPIGQISEPVETEFGYHLIYKTAERAISEYEASHIFLNIKTEEEIVGKPSEWKNTLLTGKHLKRAAVQFDPNDNTPQVGLEFDTEGAKLFEDITARNVNKPVAIFLDGEIISAPNVNEKITGGQAVISGNFNITEAKDLVKRLNAGALPVPITLVNQQTVGATLGAASVQKSLQAGLIGLCLIALFMIIVYRLPGALSVLSLVIYGLITLAIFKLWPVTMTLSGVAGFIMSLGVAVDANVLIFERLKEELHLGKSLSRAIDEGFSRAWTSIRDSNFNTILTTVILIFFTTSVIKGFAITLFLGVLVSMFTAILVTKNFLKLISENWLEKHKWLIRGVKIKQL